MKKTTIALLVFLGLMVLGYGIQHFMPDSDVGVWSGFVGVLALFGFGITLVVIKLKDFRK